MICVWVIENWKVSIECKRVCDRKGERSKRKENVRRKGGVEMGKWIRD